LVSSVVLLYCQSSNAQATKGTTSGFGLFILLIIILIFILLLTIIMAVTTKRAVVMNRKRKIKKDENKFTSYLKNLDSDQIGTILKKKTSKDPTGKEGERIIPFEVRNGPAIDIEGIKQNSIEDGVLPLMINADGKGDQKIFLIEGSETPQSIPSWVWILIIGVSGWVLYYLIAYLTLKQ